MLQIITSYRWSGPAISKAEECFKLLLAGLSTILVSKKSNIAMPCLTNDVDNPIAKLDLFGSEQSWYFLVFFGHIRLMMILSIIHKSQRKRYTTKSVVDQNNFPENMASNRLAVWSEKKCIVHFACQHYTISLFHTIRHW